jgi:hypothetical protein
MVDDNFGFTPDEDLGFLADEPENLNVDKLKAGLAGAAQGASLGFVDEMAGGLGALSYKLGELLGPKKIEATESLAQRRPEVAQRLEQIQSNVPTLGESYREARDASRGEFEALREASPGTFMLGEIAGGVANPLLAAKAGSKVGSEAIKTLAKQGAKLGAVGALGVSESDLTKGDITGAAMDVGTGAVIGSIAGGTAGALGEKLKQYKKFREFARSFQLGKEGQGISSDADQRIISGRVEEQAQKLADFIQEQMGAAGKAKKAALKGKTVDLTDVLQQADESLDELGRSVGATVDELKRAREIIQQQLYSQAPKKVKDKFQEIVTKRITEDPETGELVGKTSRVLKGKGVDAEELPELVPTDMDPKSAIFRTGEKSTIEQTTRAVDDEIPGILRGAVPAEEAAQGVQGLQRAAFGRKLDDPRVSQILKGVAAKASDVVEDLAPEQIGPANKIMTAGFDLLEQVGEPELIRSLGKKQASKETINFVRQLQDTLSPEGGQRARTVIELLQKMNPEKAQKIFGDLMRASEDFALTKAAGSGEQISTLAQFTGSIRDLALKGANLAGQASGAVGRGAERTGVPQGAQAARSVIESISPTIAKNLGITTRGAVGRALVSSVLGSREDNKAQAEYQKRFASPATPDALKMSNSDLQAIQVRASQMGDESAQRFSQELESAMNAPASLRRSKLFMMSQNPQYRKYFSGK